MSKNERFRLVSKETEIARNVSVAKTFFQRFKGLMFRKSLGESEGLFIPFCNQIHMFWMRMPLDVIFIDDKGQILFLLRNIRPWRISRLVRGSKAAVELPIGTIDATGVAVGDTLELISSSREESASQK